MKASPFRAGRRSEDFFIFNIKLKKKEVLEMEGVEDFRRDIKVVAERGIGKELNIGFYLMFENAEDMRIVHKLLNKIKDGYWDAIKISEYYFIEYSVSQKTALQKIQDAIWVWKVNKYGKVVDMEWRDVDQLMTMIEEEYKKLSKPGRKVYHITPCECSC